VNPIRRSLEDLFVELAHQNGGSHKESQQEKKRREGGKP